MTTFVRRAWMVYDGMGNPSELRCDFSDKLANFHIAVYISNDPILLAKSLMEAGAALALELEHCGIASLPARK